jgi:hypothetical protein
LDALGDHRLLGGRDVDLTYRSSLGSSEELRLVALPLLAVAARVATLAYPRPEGATDQRSLLAKKKLELTLVPLRGIEEALS